MKKIAQHSRTILLIWIAWLLILVGYQNLVHARFQPQRPDSFAALTPAAGQDDSPYLNDPFLNTQVSGDSEYYLSIAVGGYRDPRMGAVGPDSSAAEPQVALQSEQPDWVSLNFAFFPVYPVAMRLLAYPLRVFGLDPIATATLAGVLISALGTLLAMFCLFALAREELEEDGGLRAVFYLLIFPTGFFLAQVYSEGLFVGLAFASLVMMRQKRWPWAALLATLTIFTHPNGLAILLPLFWCLVSEARTRSESDEVLLAMRNPWRILLWGAMPLVAFIVWRLSPAWTAFSFVQTRFFGTAPYSLSAAFGSLGRVFHQLAGPDPQARLYNAIQLVAVLLGSVSVGLTFRKYPALALFGLGVIVIGLTGGAPLALHRSVLDVPGLFLVLGRWGKNPVFDRSWTVLSLLLMCLLAAVFSFDLFAG